MAKKSRRARKRARARATYGAGQTSAPAEATPVRDQPQELPDTQAYRYVVDDLRRVAILAAAVFALLIALSFFIR